MNLTRRKPRKSRKQKNGRSLKNTFNKKLKPKFFMRGGNYKMDIAKVYFDLFRLIKWEPGKIYVNSDKADDAADYCKTVESVDCGTITIPYTTAHSDLEPEMCCTYKDRKVTRRSVNKFGHASIVYLNNKETPFMFEGEFTKIQTTLFKIFKPNLEKDIIKKTYSGSEKKGEIAEIINDYSEEPIKKPEYTLEEVCRYADEYPILAEIAEVLDPKYRESAAFTRARLVLPAIKGEIKEVQLNTNKSFCEHLGGGKVTKHLYFSYGTTTNLHSVVWDIELQTYVKKIQEWIANGEVQNIVLGGHSVGSIVIQHLGLQLIRLGLDISKIYIIGSGCCFTPDLFSEAEVHQLKTAFLDRLVFMLTAYSKEGLFHCDFINYPNTKMSSADFQINPINTHLLVCSSEFVEGKCEAVEVINITSDVKNVLPALSAAIHDFSVYSDLFRLVSESANL